MSDNDDLGDIPPLVPDRDDVEGHINQRRAQGQEIVNAKLYTQRVTVSTWPVRIMLALLTLAIGGGAYGAYWFWELYQEQRRQAELRVGDLEVRLAMTGESAEETDNTLMENINKTIEQYDLLWANWRNNNRTFDEIRGEIARLKLANEGQDEITAANSMALAGVNETLMATETRLNNLGGQVAQLNQSLGDINASIADLSEMRRDLQSIEAALNSGDSTVLGLMGRLEYLEESMESVNAHRLQVNESLFRLQENIETLQRSVSAPGSGL